MRPLPRSDVHENLARVIEEHPGIDWLASSPSEMASAVVAYLTSDEATDRVADALAKFVEDDPHGANLLGMGDRDAARAAILAALGVESLPLDPEPWVTPGSFDSPGDTRHADRRTGNDRYAPRPGYEQRREFYGKGAE